MDGINTVSEAFIQGCLGIRIPRAKDYNSGLQAGVGYYQRTIHKGRRVSAAVAFLRPVMRPKNLEVRTNARASRTCSRASAPSAIRYLAAPDAPPCEVRALQWSPLALQSERSHRPASLPRARSVTLARRRPRCHRRP
jgi:choline dehydrogenase